MNVNEDGWDRPEKFCLYNKEVNFIKVELPVPAWMTRGDYNAAIQVWADLTSGKNALSFFKILEIWEKMRKAANAEAPEKTLTDKPSVPATWHEDIQNLIIEAAKIDGHPTGSSYVREYINWAYLWDTFQKFFEDNGIPERPYDGPTRTVRDNPQA